MRCVRTPTRAKARLPMPPRLPPGRGSRRGPVAGRTLRVRVRPGVELKDGPPCGLELRPGRHVALRCERLAACDATSPDGLPSAIGEVVQRDGRRHAGSVPRAPQAGLEERARRGTQLGVARLMWIRTSASALVCSLLVACGGRADLAGLDASSRDATSERDPATNSPQPTNSGSGLPSISDMASDGGDDCSGPDDVSVSVTVVSGWPLRVPGCDLGYAHPSLCCNAQRLCIESRTSPFRPCGCGAMTFPDPRVCCSLADPRTCFAAGPAIDAGLSGCTAPCGPGSCFSPAGGQIGPCTQTPAAIDEAGGIVPTGLCEYCCTGGGCGVDIGECGPNGNECGPLDFGCHACPDSFHHVPGMPDLCCVADAGDASVECFSQAELVWDTDEGK